MKKMVIWAIAVWGGILAPQASWAEKAFIIEKISTTGASVSHAEAYTRGTNLVVAGKVSRWHKVSVPGHVDVVIYDAHGALLGVSKKSLPGIMSRRKGRLDFAFSASFDFIPPAGAFIQVQYHWRPSCLTEKG